MHDPKRTLFYVFNLSFEKISCFLLSLCFCSKKSPQKKYLILLTFFSLFFFSEFVFFFCVVSFCLLTLLLLFLFSFFTPCFLFFCLLSSCLFTLSYVSSVCVYSIVQFLNLYYLFFVFVEKSLIFELVISLCKTFLVLSFFLFRPFSGCFFGEE